MVTADLHRNFVKLERHEAKYLIHRDEVEPIRAFIQPFVVADRNACAELPEYVVTTLQFDSPDLVLYKAREAEALNRFKLRVRTYGLEGGTHCFLEIKRKLKSVVVKSRVTLPRECWSKDILVEPRRALPLRSSQERDNYLEFVRLVQEIGARPIVHIRYHRESYIGRFDRYARVTFDRNLCYQPARSWDLCPTQGAWWTMDSTMALNRPFSGVILELKTYSDVPKWMTDMTERFNLVRIGFCKYVVAVRLETLFRGGVYSDGQETCCAL